MIRNAEDREDGWFRDRLYHVCIIGAGPAGITLARRLATHNVSVAVLEGGDLEPTTDSQDLYKGTIGAQPYFPLDGARLRYFGGSSNHWGGWTRPLDEYDFDSRPDNPGSGWPITKADLDPFAEEADGILDLPAGYDPPDMFGGAATDLVPRAFRFSQPTTRFGEKYREELQASKSIDVFLNANLVDFRLDGDRQAITEAVFRSYKRPEPFTVRARFFALCLGGIENPRALLNAANDQLPKGLGNENDLVGRYFLEHLHVPVGRVVLRDPMSHILVYSPSREFMLREGILNFGFRIGNYAIAKGPVFTGELETQPACQVRFEDLLAAELRGEQTSACPAHVGSAFLVCEQLLTPDSRVRVTNERDRFGLRKAELDWQVTPMDLRTLRVATNAVGTAMAEHDTGRLQIIDWLLGDEMHPNLDQVFGGSHHMGTTRMSDDPKTGVVDRDVKVHSLDNLYIGGSSVFASGGHANPTYTIVQLALRLGDHLARRLV